MNIREMAQFNKSYSEINREERNYAAILYAALLKIDNLEKFIEITGGSPSRLEKDFGIYFEYAFLRDLWDQIGGNEANNIKKGLILDNLQISQKGNISGFSIEDFNQIFGVSGKPSKDNISFPGKWAIQKFHPNFPDNKDFLNICRFKWSFNIKPDLVIHLNKNEAICVEIKYTSGEGSYPSSSTDKEIFKIREIKYIKQTNLQQYMMEDLLGIKTKFVFLVQKPASSSTHTIITWDQVFENLDISSMPLFIHTMLNNLGI